VLNIKKRLTRQNVDESVFEFVDRQTRTDEFHWIYLHTCQPLKYNSIGYLHRNDNNDDDDDDDDKNYGRSNLTKSGIANAFFVFARWQHPNDGLAVHVLARIVIVNPWNVLSRVHECDR